MDMHTEQLKGLHMLAGIVSGIVCDRRLDDSEIYYLKNWLNEHAFLAHEYPAKVYIQRLNEVLADGKVTSEERSQLLSELAKHSGFDNTLCIPYPHLHHVKEALMFARAGERQCAHELLKKYNDQISFWIRAVLYKIEGNKDASEFYYKRTSLQYESYPVSDAEAELEKIIEHLGFELYEFPVVPEGI